MISRCTTGHSRSGDAYRFLVVLIDLATEALVIVDLVLQAECVVLKPVSSLNLGAGGLVFLGILLSLLDHTVDLLLTETTLVVCNRDRLRLASALVRGGNLQNTVGVQLEADLNLRYATGSRGNVGELELSEEVVILRHGTFTFEDLDQDHRLVIGGRAEDLALASRDRGATLDEGGHDATGGLDTQRQRVDIHENDAGGLVLAAQDATLHSCAISNSLIGVHLLASLFAKVFLEHVLDLRDTGRTTNEDNVVNLTLLELRVLQHLLDRLEGLLEEIVVQLLEFGTGKRLREVVAVVEGLDLNAGGHLRRPVALLVFATLSWSVQATHKVRLAFSTSRFSLPIVFWFLRMSTLCSLLYFLTK